MTEYKKGIPRRDGSGRGRRLNRGRGGCVPPQDRGYFGKWKDAIGSKRGYRNRRI